MCEFYSCIITKQYKIFDDEKSNDHSKILALNGLDKIKDNQCMYDKNKMRFARIEIVPPTNKDIFYKKLSEWQLKIDEQIIPGWWSDKYEKACREKFKTYYKNHVFLNKKIKEIKNKYNIYIKNCQIDIIDSATIKNVRGSAVIREVRGSAMIEYVRDSATIKDVRGSATIKDVRGSAMIEYVGGSATIKGVGGSAVIEYVGGSATIKDVGGSATIKGVGGSAVIEYVGDSAMIKIYSKFCKIPNPKNKAIIINNSTNTIIINKNNNYKIKRVKE